VKRSRIVLPDKEYKALCLKVMNRDGYKCKFCKSRQSLSAHHIIYRSHGGDDASWNLLTLCEECHKGVHKRFLIIISIRGVEDADGNPVLVNADEGVKFIVVENWRPKRR
jgi:predicted restriction endonuclease